MDRGAAEYAQSEHSSVATYTPQTDPRSASTSTSQSDYGVAPPPARYPAEYAARYSQYPQQAPPHPGVAGNMAQPSNPSIAQQQSPTYPPYYSPHPQQGQDMSQYQGPPQQHMAYRPEWGYGQPPHMAPGQYPGHPGGGLPQGPPPPNAQRPGQQVYSFVPIPGAQQHKRPRRRYEEIERMYKCGWNGCEKAYGTLNHLNAHVTMQAHGSKRTPEEFKEIRKEWKARKKEEDAARKADDERARAAHAGPQDGQGDGQPPPGQGYQSNGGRPSLPPIGYAPAEGHPPAGQYQAPPGGMVYAQGNGPMPNYAQYPNSPYGHQQQGQPVYQTQGQPHYA